MVDVPDSGDPIIRDMLRARSVPEIGAPGASKPATPQPKPEFAQEAQPVAAAEPDPIIEEMLGQRKVSRPQIDSAQRNADPDKVARAKQLGQEYGLPTEVAERNLDDLTRRQATDEAEFWLAQSGGTQEWLGRNPDNIRIAHDSVKQLGALEQAVNVLGRAPLQGALDFLGSVPSGAATGIDVLARTTARPIQSALRAIGLPEVADAMLAPITPEEIDPLKGLAALGATIKGAAKDVGVPESERNLATDVTGGLGQVAAQITAMILTGGAAGTASLLASGADQAAERVKAKGVEGTPEGDLAVLAGGAITGITERYGLDLLLKRIPENVRSKVFQILAGASSEAVQEISENVLNNLAAIALYDPDGQILGDNTMYEGGVGAIVGGIVSAVIPGRQAIRVRKDLEKVQEDLTKTPLAQRDPAAAAEHFGAVTEAAGLEIYVPAERLAEVLKPEQIVEFGFEDRIAEAVERGGDIKLTGEQFARLAIEGLGQDLLDDMRVGEGAMNAAEAKSIVDDAVAQRRGEEAMAQAERDAASRETASAKGEQAATEPEWKASAWQRRQLIAAGFGEGEIDGMSQQDVLDLVGEKPPSPSKWSGEADGPVELAEREMGFQAMFATAAEAGMTEPQYASYLEAIAVAQEGARKRAEERAIKRQQKTLTEEWKAEREVVRQQVDQSMRQRPVYAALDALGVDRLNAEAIVEIMGGQEDILDMLPKSAGRQIFQRKGGIDPDVHAEQYGFDSGREMLDAIFNAVPIKEAIDAETDRRMVEKHGAILDKQRDLQEALEDLHNDDQAKVLTFELAAMRRAESKGQLSPALFRQAAAMGLSKLQINEINPKLFLDEEVRKGKLAGKLIRGKGKVDGQKLTGPNRDAAARAKFQQILNFEYARQAFAARKQIERQRKELERLADTTIKIPGIDANHRDRIFELTLGYDFSSSRPRGGGLVGDIHYSNMSLNAFNQLYETVKAIEKQGRDEKTLLIEGKTQDREAAIEEMLATVSALPDVARVARKATGDEGVFDRARSTLAALSTYVSKIELILQKLDGGAVAGPWHKAIFQPMVDAQTAELDLYEKTMKDLVEGVAGLPKSTLKKLGRKEFIPELGRKMTTAELLMVALNSGNASNLQKMIDGSEMVEGGQKWTLSGIEQALSKLGPDEAAWVQKVWGSFERMRPQVEEVYRSIHGISPERIMPQEMKIGGVTVKGGYFPMIYDRDARPAPQPGQATVLELMTHPAEKASVFSGMTKARVDDYAAPVSLDFTQLAHALRAPIHFVTHYDAIRNVDKILSDKKVNEALVRKLGPERRDEFRRWMEAVASNNADRHNSGKVNAFIQQVRTNLTVAVLGLSYTTLAAQVFGLSTSVAQLGQDGKGGFSTKDGVKWMMVGLDQYLSSPAETVKHATALSGEMRHRLGNSDRDLSDTLGSLSGKVSMFRIAQRASLKAIGGIQFYVVDVPTWTGAYNKGLSQGMDEQAAVEYADTILRTSQASGHTKDLAALQRQKGLPQLLTMFTTYTTLLYGLLGQTITGMKPSEPSKVAGGISRLVWLMAVPAVADAFLRQEGPPEDDEDGAMAWWGLKTLLYGVKSTPLVGQIAGSVGEGYRATLSPVENLLGTKIPQAIKSAMKLMQEDEELELKDARKIVDAVGLTIGVPGTVQVVRALKALEDEDAEFYDYLVTPKKK